MEIRDRNQSFGENQPATADMSWRVPLSSFGDRRTSSCGLTAAATRPEDWAFRSLPMSQCEQSILMGLWCWVRRNNKQFADKTSKRCRWVSMKNVRVHVCVGLRSVDVVQIKVGATKPVPFGMLLCTRRVRDIVASAPGNRMCGGRSTPKRYSSCLEMAYKEDRTNATNLGPGCDRNRRSFGAHWQVCTDGCIL